MVMIFFNQLFLFYYNFFSTETNILKLKLRLYVMYFYALYIRIFSFHYSEPWGIQITAVLSHRNWYLAVYVPLFCTYCVRYTTGWGLQLNYDLRNISPQHYTLQLIFSSITGIIWSQKYLGNRMSLLQQCNRMCNFTYYSRICQHCLWLHKIHGW